MRKRGARSAFRAWPEIAARLRSAKRWALLLDFDGTLVRLRGRPEDVRTPRRVKRMLERLAERPGVLVAIVSGRTVRDLRKLIGAVGVHYLGLHGAEGESGRVKLSKTKKAALRRAKRNIRVRIRSLAGVWIEEKGMTFAVHYRGVRPAAAQAAGTILKEVLAPLRDELYVMKGKKVREILPRGIEGKGAAVTKLLRSGAGGIATIYMGDDSTDERAFKALRGQITVRVGAGRGTRAHFYVRNPADALRLLARVEREARSWKRQ